LLNKLEKRYLSKHEFLSSHSPSGSTKFTGLFPTTIR
jgi:hypothetical protein